MIFSKGIRKPVTATGHFALTTVSGGATIFDDTVEAGIQRQVGEEGLHAGDAAPEKVAPKAEL